MLKLPFPSLPESHFRQQYSSDYAMSEKADFILIFAAC